MQAAQTYDFMLPIGIIIILLLISGWRVLTYIAVLVLASVLVLIFVVLEALKFLLLLASFVLAYALP